MPHTDSTHMFEQCAHDNLHLNIHQQAQAQAPTAAMDSAPAMDSATPEAVLGTSTALAVAPSGHRAAALSLVVAGTTFGGNLLVPVPGLSPVTSCDGGTSDEDDTAPEVGAGARADAARALVVGTTSKAPMPHKGPSVGPGNDAKSEATEELAAPQIPLAEPGAEPSTHTALAVKSEESDEEQPTHHKFNVVLLNFGQPRVKGHEAYFANLLHLPC